MKQITWYIVIVASICMMSTLMAQEESKPTADVKEAPAKTEKKSSVSAPTIPDSDQKDFFKKQIAFIQAQSQLQQAVDKMNKDCGDSYVLQITPQGDPFCMTTAKAPKPAETPKPEPKK